MKRFFPLLLCALAAPAFADDLAPSAKDGSLWEADAQALSNRCVGARYTRVDEQTLRFSRQKLITFDKLNLTEMLVHFDTETKKLNLLQGSVYNKGDDGPVEREAFLELHKATVEKLNSLLGVEGKPQRMNKRDTGIKLNALIWQTDNCVVLLESAASGKRKDFVSEFIRVTIGPDEESLERGGAQDATRRNALKEKVKKEENGDVWIEGIPMVDQGQKGYCVPASVSRVFAHYGMDGVDQHALAALCKSSGEHGTSWREMESALEDISRSFHMRVTPLDKGGYGEMFSAYNAMAKKMKKPLLSASEKPKFDPEVLLAARAGKEAVVRKWMKPIMKSIDAGLPVLWSVQLGIYPEQGLQQDDGGHMRLIIGYNEKEETIIYSDSWGARHARKEMPADEACAMTVRRYVLKPMR